MRKYIQVIFRWTRGLCNWLCPWLNHLASFCRPRFCGSAVAPNQDKPKPMKHHNFLTLRKRGTVKFYLLCGLRIPLNLMDHLYMDISSSKPHHSHCLLACFRNYHDITLTPLFRPLLVIVRLSSMLRIDTVQTTTRTNVKATSPWVG